MRQAATSEALAALPGITRGAIATIMSAAFSKVKSAGISAARSMGEAVVRAAKPAVLATEGVKYAAGSFLQSLGNLVTGILGRRG
jgi:predicted Na+-dependent transporter